MICCSRNAAFTYRMSTETEVEVIGGTDKYVAACRGCYDDQSEKDFVLASKLTLTPKKLTPKKRNYPEMSEQKEVSPAKQRMITAPVF